MRALLALALVACGGAAPDAPFPVDVTARAGGLIDVAWAAPADHGDAITAYLIESIPPGFSASTTSLALTTSALTIGTSYQLSVKAQNGAGLGPAATSASVVAGDVPSAPSAVSAAVNGLVATVAWDAATGNGYALTGYTVVADNGGPSLRVAGDATSTPLTGLADAQAYRFTVSARNALGDGPLSAPSNAVTTSCVGASYAIFAADLTTVQYAGDANTTPLAYLEARRDARGAPFVARDSTAWARFHLPDPPLGPPPYALVTAARLTMNVSSAISAPAPTEVAAWYSEDDGWRSSAVLSDGDVRRTQQVSAAVPLGGAGSQLIADLDVAPAPGAHDWSRDLGDRDITVGLADADLGDPLTYVRFLDASAGGATLPLLKLTVCQ